MLCFFNPLLTFYFKMFISDKAGIRALKIVNFSRIFLSLTEYFISKGYDFPDSEINVLITYFNHFTLVMITSKNLVLIGMVTSPCLQTRTYPKPPE